MKTEIIAIMNEADLQQAFAVRREVFIDEQQVPEELEMDEHDQTAQHFLIRVDGEIAGASRLRHYSPEGTGKVERVAVRQQFRGLGIGASLMEGMEAHALAHGFHTLKLNSQLQASDFYRKLGYEPHGDIFMDANIEHIAMTKKLDTACPVK